MKLNKLVRDKIPEIIRKRGATPVTHISSESEYWQKLVEKLQEEVDEFKEAENEEELADVLEVIYAICDYKNINRASLETLHHQKATERGGFRDRIILEETKS